MVGGAGGSLGIRPDQAQSVDMVLTGEVTWGEAGLPRIAGGLNPTGLQVQIEGETRVDLGYGLVTVPLAIHLP